MRQPFPGPGLGVRIIGEVTRERVEIVRKADFIFISMIKEAGLYNEVRKSCPSSLYESLTEARSPKPMLGSIPTEVCFLSKRIQNHVFVLLTCSIAVGVQGDARVYGYICVLRAVTSLDMMSAEPYEFSWSLLKAISRRIVNEVDGIARVVYDTTSKPPGKIPILISSWKLLPYGTNPHRHDRIGVINFTSILYKIDIAPVFLVLICFMLDSYFKHRT